MTHISQSIEAIRSACERLGVNELSRLADVPYTTVRSLLERDFKPKTVGVLEKLERVAAEHPTSNS